MYFDFENKNHACAFQQKKKYNIIFTLEDMNLNEGILR